MPTIKDILAAKGPHVLTIGRDATVLHAATLMNEHKVGCLIVVEQGQLAGIFTERDVLRRVVAERRDPMKTTVGEVMTLEVACCGLETTLEEARSVFKHRRIRHLPVVDEESHILGLISIGDLNAHEADAQETTIHFLHQYIYGRV